MSGSPARPTLIPTRRHGRPIRALRAPAAAAAASASRAVTPGPSSWTSRTAMASRTWRPGEAATRSAGRTIRPAGRVIKH